MKRVFCLILTIISLSLCVNVKAATQNSQVTVLDAKYENLEVLTNSELDNIDNSMPLFQFQKDDKYGIVDKDGIIIADAVYDDIWEYYQGFITVVKDDKIGYLDKTGKKISEVMYDLYPRNFYEGLAAVHTNDKWGFIDTTGKQVIPLIYDNAFNFVDGVVPVCINEKWGLIDKKGIEVVAPQYAQIGYVGEGSGIIVSFQDGIAQVKDFNEKWGYIDKTGKEVVEPQFDEAYVFSNGFAKYVKDLKMGLVDRNGIVLAPLFDYIYDFEENNITLFVQSNKIGLLNKTMAILAIEQYDAAKTITPEGYITVKKANKYGFINKVGKEIIKPQYKKAGSFYNGLAPVDISGKIGYINIKNKLVIPAKFDDGDYDADFNFKTAIAKKAGKYGIINKSGKFLAEPLYEQIEKNLNNQLYIVKLKGKYGILNKNGTVILKPAYTEIDVRNNIICATTNNVSKLFGLDGKQIINKNFVDMRSGYLNSEDYEVFIYEKSSKMGAVIYKTN